MRKATRERLAVMRAEFTATLVERLEQLGSQAAELLDGGPPTPTGPAEELYRAVHTLAGTAGSFGFRETSRLARRLEMIARALSEGDESVREALRERLEELQRGARREVTGAREPAPPEPAPPEPTQSAAPSSPDQAAPKPAANAIRVVAVDDDPVALEAVEAACSAAGFFFRGTTSPAAAQGLIREVRPDVLISDVLMPGLDGYELTRRLRADVPTRLLPVLLLTSLDAPEDQLRGLAAGCDDYLTKPWDDRVLIARIRSLVAARRPTRLLNQRLGPRAVASLVRGEPVELEGGRHLVTTLCTAVEGFDRLAKQHPPAQVMQAFDEACTLLVGIVAVHGGSVDRLSNDALMGRFYDSERDPFGARSARAAVSAALEWQEGFDELATGWAARGLPPLSARSAIASGPCVVGNAGWRHSLQRTFVGASLDEVLRLRSHARDLGLPLVLSDATADLVEGYLQLRDAGELVLPGRDAPMRVFTVEGR